MELSLRLDGLDFFLQKTFSHDPVVASDFQSGGRTMKCCLSQSVYTTIKLNRDEFCFRKHCNANLLIHSNRLESTRLTPKNQKKVLQKSNSSIHH